MRIAIDGLLLHGRYSGVEHSIRSLVLALQEVNREHEFVLYVPSDSPDAEIGGRTLSVRRAPFSGSQRAARVLWQQFGLPRALRREGVGLLHGPGYTLPLRCPVPAVVNIHDLIALVRPDLARRANVWHYSYMLPRSVRRAQRVIVHSEHTKADLARRLGTPQGKIRVIRLGIRDIFRPATQPYDAAVKARHKLPQRYFLMVGNLEPKKNVWGAIDAFGSYCRSGAPAAGLVIAGARGWMPRAYDHLLEEFRFRERVLSLGYVPEADLPALYSAATALLFPSLYEGTGLPPLEAMACGTPVICSDRGALPETVGEAAVVLEVEEETYESRHGGALRFGFLPGMHETMRRMVEDDAFCEELVAKGRRRAAQFSWRRHAQETLELYAEAAQEARPGAAGRPPAGR
ncbi:MAG: glycosyltransferase family 4 protein [Armatimonadota bacterium]